MSWIHLSAAEIIACVSDELRHVDRASIEYEEGASAIVLLIALKRFRGSQHPAFQACCEHAGQDQPPPATSPRCTEAGLCHGLRTNANHSQAPRAPSVLEKKKISAASTDPRRSARAPCSLSLVPCPCNPSACPRPFSGDVGRDCGRPYLQIQAVCALCGVRARTKDSHTPAGYGNWRGARGQSRFALEIHFRCR